MRPTQRSRILHGSAAGPANPLSLAGYTTIGAVLVALALLGMLVLRSSSPPAHSPPDRSSPSATVTGYYNALSNQDYNRAWQYMADSRNNVDNQSADISSLREDDARSGKVLSATIGSVQDSGSTQATVQVTVKRALGGGTVISYTVTLTQFDGNTWLIVGPPEQT